MTIKRAFEALKENSPRLGWAVAEGFIGGGVGVLMVALYLRSR